MPDTILDLAADLAAGRTTSRALTEQALARIEDPSGEGQRAFLHVDREAALTMADASDRLRAHGVAPSPLAGLPISIKDLFDVAGQVTTAGSVVLKDAAPAATDAPVVARVRAAGGVPIGRTNMTEFAFSGIGANPHYGTPGNPHDRARVPGGSSSGAAVSVADGMAVAALGTDTGGSVRIPSAFCGITGFKPTQKRVPLDGAAPLSFSLDSIGPLAASVACCAILDSVLAGEQIRLPDELPFTGLRFAVPRQYVLDDLDDAVASAFEATLSRLSAAGAAITDIPLAELHEIPQLSANGGFPAAEAYAWHRDLLDRAGDRYDPRVGSRIRRGTEISAADYIDLVNARADLIARVHRLTAPFDAVLMPTVAILAPRMADLEADDDYYRINLLSLRNCTVGNFLDRCAASLPCQAPGDLPVGLMIMGEHGADHRILSIAAAVEAALSNQ